MCVAVALATACSGPGRTPGQGEPTSASGTTPAAQPPPGQAALAITTQIGEQCPHIPVTPDPRCDPKPRPNTAFEVHAAGGGLVHNGRSGADGRATVFVRPGTYVVRGEPVAGYQFTPERRVTVSGSATVAVPLTYTNGIQ